MFNFNFFQRSSFDFTHFYLIFFFLKEDNDLAFPNEIIWHLGGVTEKRFIFHLKLLKQDC